MLRVDERLPQAAARVERMLTVAPLLGVDLDALAVTHRRLAFHEHERQHLMPSAQRAELDRLVEADLEALCQGFLMLERAIGSRARCPALRSHRGRRAALGAG